MSTVSQGEVLRFDPAKGYGFIATGSGGDDIFLHVNDLLDDWRLIKPGATVEFVVQQGEKGLRASSVCLVDNTPSHTEMPTNMPEVPHRVRTVTMEETGSQSADTIEPVNRTAPGKESPARTRTSQDITERLLALDPSLSGRQIVAVREMTLSYCVLQGWIR